MSIENNILNGFSGEWNIEKFINQKKGSTSGSFYLCNLSDVLKKFEDWIVKMPRVKPFYAVKCNDHLEVLKTLASVGCSFDCASAGEISKILSLNVEPNRIIFANTTKSAEHIEFAKQNSINLLTFDNEDELHKIVRLYPSTNLVLRIRYSSEKAKYKLGKKFGCNPTTEALELLQLAKSLKLNVVGISFHIGSSCEDYDVYCEAIKVSRRIFDIAETIGYNFNLLDMGGGFPGDNFSKINEFSVKINKALEESFPVREFSELKVMSEPGRYFVESAFTLVTMIHSRKISRNKDSSIEEVMYYLNEGIYSNFLFIPIGPETVEPKILRENQSSSKFKSTLWGPTCDSSDVLCEDIEMELLNIGDIIYFTNMGAYTIPLRTPFNGFAKTPVLNFIDFNDCVCLNFSLFDLVSSNARVISE